MGRLRVSTVRRCYFLPSVTVSSTRRPQEWLRLPSNTFTKQKIILYLVGLNNFEVLSWGLQKLFQMPGFNLSPSKFYILLPECCLPGLKEDSTLLNPEKKAPTIAQEWLPSIAFGNHTNHLARKSHPTPCSPHDGRLAAPSWGATKVTSALGKEGYAAFPLHSDHHFPTCGYDSSSPLPKLTKPKNPP